MTEINVTALSGVNHITSTAYGEKTTWWGAKEQYVMSSSSWAGAWNATIKSGDAAGGPNNFLGFCLDIGNSMSDNTPYNPSYTYKAQSFVSGSGTTGGNNDGAPPDPTWATASSGQRAAWIYSTYVSTVNTAAERSAMCIAIWESLYEGSGTFGVTTKSTTGRTFSVCGSGLSVMTEQGKSVADLANSWLLASVGADFSKLTSIWWAEAECHDVQSILGPGPTPIPDGGDPVVPEPSTIIAGALLLLPFGASTIKRIRKNAKA